MDSGVDRTRRFVIIFAVLLGLLILLVIGYSLWQKASTAESQLAAKTALDNQTQPSNSQASISLTPDAQKSSNFSYDQLTNKTPSTQSATNTFEVVNETPVTDVPPEATPTQQVVQQDITPTPIPVAKTKTTATVSSSDRPLTAAEIAAIRHLPVEYSPSGQLQNLLQKQFPGQYTAQY